MPDSVEAVNSGDGSAAPPRAVSSSQAATPASSGTSTSASSADNNKNAAEVVDLAKMILNAASEKSSSEAEKKLLAAVMMVHMKYSESLNVIEKLITDRQKVDARLKFLETQLSKKSKSKENKQYWPTAKEPITAGPAEEKRAGSAGRPKSAAANRVKLNKTAPAVSEQAEEKQMKDAHDYIAAPLPEPSAGDQDMPDDPDEELIVLPSAPAAPETKISLPKASAEEPVMTKKKSKQSKSSGSEEKKVSIVPPYESSEGASPARNPAADSTRVSQSMTKSKNESLISMRRSEIMERIKELEEYEASGQAVITVTTPARPSTAPTTRDSLSGGFVISSRPESAASPSARSPMRQSASMRRRVITRESIKQEKMDLEQELYELEQRERFIRASKLPPSEFLGMKQREEMMLQKRKEKIQSLEASVAETARLMEEKKMAEEAKQKKQVERALKSAAAPGGVALESWQERQAYEEQMRKQRREVRREEIKQMAAPLTKSMEQSIQAFIAIKGIDAAKAPPPKTTVLYKCSETPEQVAARIAEEARIIEESEKKKAEDREKRKKEMLVPDPVAVALIDRLEKQRQAFEAKMAAKHLKEQEKAAEEARKEQQRLAKFLETGSQPVVKPTNAQIAHNLEVTRAEEARAAEEQRVRELDATRAEKAKNLWKTIYKTDPSANRVVLSFKTQTVTVPAHLQGVRGCAITEDEKSNSKNKGDDASSTADAFEEDMGGEGSPDATRYLKPHVTLGDRLERYHYPQKYA